MKKTATLTNHIRLISLATVATEAITHRICINEIA